AARGGGGAAVGGAGAEGAAGVAEGGSAGCAGPGAGGESARGCAFATRSATGAGDPGAGGVRGGVSSAIGTVIIATSRIEAKAPARPQRDFHNGGRAGICCGSAGASAMPSNRRIAAAIAASRRAGRGGGALGSRPERPSSPIQASRPAHAQGPGTGSRLGTAMIDL
ncbi:hypothetical protein CA228_20505, partial [Sphingomonas koreensis]